MPYGDPDAALRLAALAHVRALNERFEGVVPVQALRVRVQVGDARISLGSFQKGIHRPSEFRGEAALTLTTSARDPYSDDLDVGDRSIRYHYRSGPIDQADNRALRAAYVHQVPLIWFKAVDRGQYIIGAPVFVTADDPVARSVLLEFGLPVADTQGDGLVSPPAVREYALREVRQRVHQDRFSRAVLRAYSHQCAVCALREPLLLQAAHIVGDTEPDGIAAVVNGLALCAIHHLAYDRNVMGIDPDGVVHIASRVRREIDGPMLREGLQGFHLLSISRPASSADHPDPRRLEWRYDRFLEAEHLEAG